MPDVLSVSLTPLDVGFDLRVLETPVICPDPIPPGGLLRVKFVGPGSMAQTVTGTRWAVGTVLRAAGYTLGENWGVD